MRSRRPRRWPSPALTCALALSTLAVSACSGAKKQPTLADAGPVTSRSSGAAGRERVSITVYNQNFGLVREERRVAIGKGRVALSFRDVSAHVQPETVHIRSASHPSELTVLEQSYRYDLLSPETLLRKYVGKTVSVYRYDEARGVEEKKAAKVLAVEGGTVLEIDGEITSGYDGRFAFPEVPENLVASPTLVWLLASGAPEQRLEVTYLTQNLNWRADYVLVLDASAETADLTGWVTLENESGASYENATLKLVAGDVQKLAPPPPPEVPSPMPMPTVAAKRAAPPEFQRESLFEYHLYALERPTTLANKEKKQIALLEANGVRAEKKLVFRGERHFFRGPYGQVAPKQKVGVYVELRNEEKNGLGMPLPMGTVRVYQADRSGAKQFVGEDAIEHTPRDEKLRLKLGEAFDVVGERVQKSWQVLGACVNESSWKIELRNHKDSKEVVEVYEPIDGDWEIVSASHRAEREDAHGFSFELALPARGKAELEYRVRVRWC